MDLIYKTEKLSIHLHFWHANHLTVFVSIETELAKNEKCAFKPGSQNLLLQGYRIHHSLAGVHKRPRCKQPITCKATG